MAMLVYAGEEVEAGQRAVAPFRALAEPIVDMLKPMPYPEIYPPEEDDFHPIVLARTMFIASIDRDVSQTILEHLRASDAPMRVAQIRVLGGAIARVPAEATAFAHRSSRIMVNVAAFYEGAEVRAARKAWVSHFAAALRQGEVARTWASLARRARRESARPILSLPGIDSLRSSVAMTPVPLPAQPEHSAGDRAVDLGDG
jgi:hypothetical protein